MLAHDFPHLLSELLLVVLRPRSDALLLPFTVASGGVLDNNTHAKGP